MSLSNLIALSNTVNTASNLYSDYQLSNGPVDPNGQGPEFAQGPGPSINAAENFYQSGGAAPQGPGLLGGILQLGGAYLKGKVAGEITERGLDAQHDYVNNDYDRGGRSGRSHRSQKGHGKGRKGRKGNNGSYWKGKHDGLREALRLGGRGNFGGAQPFGQIGHSLFPQGHGCQNFIQQRVPFFQNQVAFHGGSQLYNAHTNTLWSNGAVSSSNQIVSGPRLDVGHQPYFS